MCAETVMLIRSLNAKDAAKNMNYCSNQIRICLKLMVAVKWKIVRTMDVMNLFVLIVRTAITMNGCKSIVRNVALRNGDKN